MSHITLINPYVPHAEILSTLKVNSPPLGLAYIAAILEKNGYEVDILDAQTLELSRKELKMVLARRKPDVIGIYAATPGIYSALQVAENSKEVIRNATVVLGGPHVTFIPEEVLKTCPEVDVVAIGEGEYTMLELVQTLERNETDLSRVKGIAFRKNDSASSKTVVRSPPRRFIENLDELPFPARHLLPMNHYKVFGKKTIILHSCE